MNSLFSSSTVLKKCVGPVYWKQISLKTIRFTKIFNNEKISVCFPSKHQ